MFDLKAIDIKRLAFKLFEHYNTDHKSNQKQESGRAWLIHFLAKNQQISIPPIANSLLTKEFLLKRTNEHFDALKNIYTKYNIHASRIYSIEFSKFSNSITRFIVLVLWEFISVR